MDQNINLPKDFSMQEAMRLAKSPAGQQLISMLQRQSGDNLQKAVNSAASGDVEQAKLALSSLLSDPETKKLLEQLGR